MMSLGHSSLKLDQVIDVCRLAEGVLDVVSLIKPEWPRDQLKHVVKYLFVPHDSPECNQISFFVPGL